MRAILLVADVCSVSHSTRLIPEKNLNTLDFSFLVRSIRAWAHWILWCTGSTPGEVGVKFMGRMRMATGDIDIWFIYF